VLAEAIKWAFFRSLLEIAMSNHSVHKAAELAPDERLLVERWLGRALSDNETVSVSAYRSHVAPSGDQREALRRAIVSQSQEIGSRAQDVTEEEVDSLLDEAFTEIRGKRG
jgi:hypothetical protein